MQKGSGERSEGPDRGCYHLIQEALRKTGNNTEIPDLLKRLALLRHQPQEKTANVTSISW